MRGAVRSGTRSQFTCMSAQRESTPVPWAEPGESGLASVAGRALGGSAQAIRIRMQAAICPNTIALILGRRDCQDNYRAAQPYQRTDSV